MNPFAPPSDVVLRVEPPSNGPLQNPARFLLYPLAGCSVVLFFLMESPFIRNPSNFTFSLVDFLNLVVPLIFPLLGICAIVLAAKRFSAVNRRRTIGFGLVALGLLGVSLCFEQPASPADVYIVVVAALVLSAISYLAFRYEPNGFGAEAASQ